MGIHSVAMVTCCCMPGGYVPQCVSLSRACFSCHKTGLDCSCSLRGSLSPASGNSQEAPVPHTLEREEPDPTLRPHKHFPATSSIGGLWPCLRSSQIRYERFLQLMTPQVGRVISVTSTVEERKHSSQSPLLLAAGRAQLHHTTKDPTGGLSSNQ